MRVFDDQPAHRARQLFPNGRAGWPIWLHHEHQDLHWQVLEVIEPESGCARLTDTDRHVLKARGPFA
jgi:hypothetical protein